MKTCPTCNTEVIKLFYGECFECSSKEKTGSITTSDRTDDIFGLMHIEQNYCQTIYGNKE